MFCIDFQGIKNDCNEFCASITNLFTRPKKKLKQDVTDIEKPKEKKTLILSTADVRPKKRKQKDFTNIEELENPRKRKKTTRLNLRLNLNPISTVDAVVEFQMRSEYLFLREKVVKVTVNHKKRKNREEEATKIDPLQYNIEYNSIMRLSTKHKRRMKKIRERQKMNAWKRKRATMETRATKKTTAIEFLLEEVRKENERLSNLCKISTAKKTIVTIKKKRSCQIKKEDEAKRIAKREELKKEW